MFDAPVLMIVRSPHNDKRLDSLDLKQHVLSVDTDVGRKVCPATVEGSERRGYMSLCIVTTVASRQPDEIESV